MSGTPRFTVLSGAAESLLGKLADEFLESRRRNEPQSVDDLAARHPELADVIRRMFPAMLALGDPRPEASPPGGLLQGEELGDFRLLHELGRAGMGVVFEMSGALKAIEDAFRIVRHGGNVVLFGIPARPATIDIAESLIFKNLTVSAVNGREIWETWYTTRWLLEHGVVDLRPLITAELPLERFDEAFALLGTGEACKIVLRPNGATP